jgi:hypothetical protein
MRPNVHGSPAKLIEFVLKHNENNNVIVIGPNLIKDYWWWRVWFKNKSRLKIFNKVSFEKYVEYIKNSEACIDTYPMPGGIAFVEMYLMGLTPCGVHSGITGLSVTDLAKANSVEGMFSKDAPNNLEDLALSVHSVSSVKKRYLDALDYNFHSIPKVLLPNADLDMNLFHVKGRSTLNLDDQVVFSYLGKLNVAKNYKVFINTFQFSSFFTFLIKKSLKN